MAPGSKAAVLIKDAMAVPTGSHVKAISLNGKTSSKYIGVTLRKSSQQWQAEIRINGKRKYLGNFSTQVEAAVAYNKAAADTGKPLNILPKGASSKASASSTKKSSSSSSKKSSKPKKRPQSQSQRKSSIGSTKRIKDSSENQSGGSATKEFSVGKRARVEEGEGKVEKRKSSDHSSSSSSYSRSEIHNVEETQMTYLALREFGWTHKSAPRKFELQTNWVYLRPGATLKDGAVDTHLFLDEASAVSFAHDWCVGIGGRSGHVGELPPTLAECAARDELTLVIEQVKEVKGVAKAPLAPSATAFDLENCVDTSIDDKGSVHTASREEVDTALPSIRATEEARDFVCCSDVEKESDKDKDKDDDDYEVIIGADDFAAELDRAQEVHDTYSGPATPPTPPTPKYVAPNAATVARKRAAGSTSGDDDTSPLIRSHTTSVLTLPYSPLRKKAALIPNSLGDQKQNEMSTTSSSSSSAEVLATPHTPPMKPMFVTPNGPGQSLDLPADSNARWMKAPWIGLWSKSASRAPWSV